MKFTFKTEYLGGELVVETDKLSDILDIFTAKGPVEKTEEKDPNQMELPFNEEPKPEVVEEVKKTRKPRAKKEERVVVEKETNIAGVEIVEESEVMAPVETVVEEPKTYTTADLQKAIIDFVTKTPEGRDVRTNEVKELVLKYSKTTAAADFPVKKIGEFLKDLEALA